MAQLNWEPLEVQSINTGHLECIFFRPELFEEGLKCSSQNCNNFDQTSTLHENLNPNQSYHWNASKQY